jgi:hypothetical protein
MQDDRNQRDMLYHIRKIAGVEGVAVVHAPVSAPGRAWRNSQRSLALPPVSAP